MIAGLYESIANDDDSMNRGNNKWQQVTTCRRRIGNSFGKSKLWSKSYSVSLDIVMAFLVIAVMVGYASALATENDPEGIVRRGKDGVYRYYPHISQDVEVIHESDFYAAGGGYWENEDVATGLEERVVIGSKNIQDNQRGSLESGNSNSSNFSDDTQTSGDSWVQDGGVEPTVPAAGSTTLKKRPTPITSRSDEHRFGQSSHGTDRICSRRSGSIILCSTRRKNQPRQQVEQKIKDKDDSNIQCRLYTDRIMERMRSFHSLRHQR